MNQKKDDAAWQTLQDHIVQTFNRYLIQGTDLIEYKPRFPVYLLTMLQEDRKDDLEDLRAR
jgi:hypothetical protein